MRPPTLQYFYLEKPMILLILITFISVFLWIGKGDFYTKGEPREASVAVSMLEKNQWVLATEYADEIAYKPPLTHWLMAVFSMPRGKVTPLSARLPSALAFMGLIVTSFLFFGKNLKFQDSFLAALILLTAFELHRAAMTARVDMLLTFLIVWALTRLFRWEERKKLKGFPVWVVLLQGLAVLTKGPVGIVLPMLVFGIYLLFLKYNFWKIAGKLIPVALASLVLPAIWYFGAYQMGGKSFLDVVWAENFGRFLGSQNLPIHYALGHEEGWWYNCLTLAAGFIPWTILLFISLFGLNYLKKIPSVKSLWNSFIQQDKIKLFSVIAAIVIIVFYSIPLSKRSVYLMPAYPFISIFIAQYVFFVRENKPKLFSGFTVFIAAIACIVSLIVLLIVIFPVIDPVLLASHFVKRQQTLDEISATWQVLRGFSILHVLLLLVLLYSIFVYIKHFRKKNYLKILYATIAVYLALNLVLDGIFIPAYADGISVKPYAKALQKNYQFGENDLFVTNDLLKYGGNMYGLNFYLHNKFNNFEKEQPSEGFFLVGKNDFEKVSQEYGKEYKFTLLEEYNNKTRDGERVILLFTFDRHCEGDSPKQSSEKQ